GVDSHQGQIQRVKVLLPLPLEALYDYQVTEGMALAPGDLVEVPLGKRRVIGAVWDPEETADEIPASRLKAVIDRLEAVPLPESQRRFIEWVSRYTMAPLGAVLRMALPVPAALRPERP